MPRPRPPSPPQPLLSGRTALVTGANRGLGLEVCRQLAGLGPRVVLTCRDLAKGRRAAAGLPGDVLVRPLDVAADDAGERAEAIDRELGGVDVLVNNAAIHYDSDEDSLGADFRVVEEALRTNLLGAWRVAKALAPRMRARRWGRIVNVSSEAGSLASMGGGTPAYAISKAALNALTRTMAGDLRGSGVLVNAVCPGWVATDMGGPGGRPVPAGAASIVWAATLPDGGPTGGFFRDGRPLPW
ncbi:MAG TPA: SDR family NAD(P)-dependent oxidoreductase [Anaeromyxobacter sp.]|nr:SDR family NAD(P)-dependent oxidoreductase [Anaeromyxobacter sp.]